MKKISEIGGEWSFWTITLPSWIHKLETEEKRTVASLQKIRDSWDKFMKWMKRQYGKFEYVRVFETHESGVLHVHFLASFHVPPEDFRIANKGKKNQYGYSSETKKVTVGYGLGKMHSVENLPIGDFARTVGYVTKYMTKEDDFVTKYLSKMRVRRIQTSRKIGAVPKGKSEYEWVLTPSVHIYEIKDGLEVFDLNRGKIIKEDDFEGEHHYPTFAEIMRNQAKATIAKDENEA